MDSMRIIQKYIITVVCCLALLPAMAQYKVTIIVDSLPDTLNTGNLFFTGSVNGWDPKNEKYILRKEGKSYSIRLSGIQSGTYEYKFTRGSWETVEVGTGGEYIGNRHFSIHSDTIVYCRIDGWKDGFPGMQKHHTASPRVLIPDTVFTIPALNRSRKISVYIPENYQDSKARYPVIYMLDGQNLFDDWSAFNAEWGVDEAADSLIKKGKPAAIIVGIDNGPQRTTEYSPYPFDTVTKTEADSFLSFIIHTIKPYIDSHLRTASSKIHTTIAGSSLGGLFSYYALLTHPDVFGNAGLFSPSFHINMPALKSLTVAQAGKAEGKVFFYIGEPEGGTYVENLKEIADELGTHSRAVIYRLIDPLGKHDEAAWRKWFPEFYTWILSDGLNTPVTRN
jgi:predicted alpha/beta superfamily hydrolase